MHHRDLPADYPCMVVAHMGLAERPELATSVDNARQLQVCTPAEDRRHRAVEAQRLEERV